MFRGSVVLAAFVSFGCALSARAVADAATSTAPKGTDSFRLKFRLVEHALRPKLTLTFVDQSTWTLAPHAEDETTDEIYVEYKERGNYEKANGPVPKHRWKDVRIAFEGLGVFWYARPNPHYYNLPIPPKTIDAWERAFPSAVATDMVFEARKDGEDVAFYVNGQYAGRRRGAKRVWRAKITGMNPVGEAAVAADDLSLEDNGPKFELSWFAAEPPSDAVVLPCRGTQHAADVLRDGKSTLSLKSGRQTVGGVPMEVFAPDRSVEIARHDHAYRQGGLFGDTYYNRTAYNVSPEFAQWCVPNGFYTHAWVLCADVPRPGAKPYVGVQVTRFGDLGSSALPYTEATLEGAKEVGTLAWTEKGVRKTAALKLVKVPIGLGKILDLVNDKPLYMKGLTFERSKGERKRLDRGLPTVDDYLDFEFNGGGYWGRTPSSVQVFGVTLVKSPIAVEMVQSEFGNLFYNDEKPETGVEVTALADGVKGFVDAIVYDDAFRVLSTNTQPFAIAKAGGKSVLRFDLAQKELGWYGLDFVFRNADGGFLLTHEAKFALLGKDTREAGYDSPYAAWPHNGRHNSQPDLYEVAKKMHKMGLRKSWGPPGESEEDPQLKPFSITRSILISNGQPGAPTTAENLQKDLDARVAEGRENLKKFPHMSRVIQLLHEQGGRELAPEMLYKPAVRGAYKGIEGRWETYFCTEFCKRMRREFPDFDIQIGNGSSASEKIASLCRDGFDLNLVTQLGIESKGFGTMPEECANLEAPGMLWALRETGRRFGFTNFTMNACNEYVFRAEREIPRDATYRQRMEVTCFYLRDYLVSLAHGVRCISTSHLEDSKTSYYNTAWGAGCMCETFPYGYPKRCLVAIATLTKVLDCVERYPRRVPTGEVATYALEWKRNRREKDLALAIWTPSHFAKAKLVYPPGTVLRQISTFGVERALKPDADGAVSVEIGPAPVYFVSSRPCESGYVVEHVRETTDGFVKVADVNTATVEPVPLVEKPESYPMVGKFTHADVEDPQLGKTLSAMLVKREQPLPEVVWEYEHLRFREPVVLNAEGTDRVGLWVKGNGAFGGIEIVLADPADLKRTWKVKLGYRNKITFHGWHFLSGPIDAGRAKPPARLVVDHLLLGSARRTLDPREMVSVTEPVGIGPLLVKPLDGKSASAVLSPAEAQTFAAMAAVPDRDLAGEQLTEKGAIHSTPTSTPNTYTFSSDMVTFLTKENRQPGFAKELAMRVTAAWRRDPENCFKAKRETFETRDRLLLALTAWVGPGLPEAKPDRRVERAEKIFEIRSFAEELRTAPPTFEVEVPEGVFCCVRRGECGKNSVCFFNLSAVLADFTLWLPKDLPCNWIELQTGRVWSSKTHGWYHFKLKPREFQILRSNSTLPGGLSEADDGLTLDEDL